MHAANLIRATRFALAALWTVAFARGADSRTVLGTLAIASAVSDFVDDSGEAPSGSLGRSAQLRAGDYFPCQPARRFGPLVRKFAERMFMLGAH